MLIRMLASSQDFGDDIASLTVRAAHNYWAQKAAKSKTPLLQCFWFDKRWARQNAVKSRKEELLDVESDDGIPFQGKEVNKGQRGKGRIRQLSQDEIRARLFAARLGAVYLDPLLVSHQAAHCWQRAVVSIPYVACDLPVAARCCS